MSDQDARRAARYAPGSLEELAWGVRTGQLVPRDPNHLLRPWVPSAAQLWRAERTLDVVANALHVISGWRYVLVLECWLGRDPRWTCTLSATEPSPVAWCESSRPARHGIPLARVAERLVAWSRYVVQVNRGAGVVLLGRVPRGRVTLTDLPTFDLLSNSTP